MARTLLRLLPVVIGIGAGLSLRRLGMVDQRDGETVFKLVFYVFLPAVMFTSLSTVHLGRHFAIFPLVAVVVIAVGYLAGRLVAARAELDPVTGLAVSTAVVLLLGLHGMDRTIVLLIGVAPLAFACVTFASLENLDTRLATSALSLSLATGLVLSLLITLTTA